METMKLVLPLNEEMTAIRRHIHQHPELSNEEFETTKLIREKLTEYGIEIAEIGLKTGVLGILRGKKPGKTVAIREDIDALPMPELTELPFASEIPNVCHSCGHDIHTTVLLYCARVLSQIRDELSGTVMFLFQPAEEKGCGAKQFIDCDFTRAAKPDVFIGLHVSPEYDAGTIALKKGPGCASNDFFHIKISGKGGHGAHPENFVDPVMISAYVLTQLQTIVSRENHPISSAVLTIGNIQGGKAANIVPDFVEMQGTLRTLTPELRESMKQSVERIVTLGAETLRGKGEITWGDGMPPLVNDDTVLDLVAAAAEKTIGADRIFTFDSPSLGSEDFSCLFPEYAPGAQFRLGSGNSDPNTRHGIHNSKNTFDEDCIAAGTAALVQFVRDYLN